MFPYFQEQELEALVGVVEEEVQKIEMQMSSWMSRKKWRKVLTLSKAEKSLILE